jgi:hypothetical protein
MTALTVDLGRLIAALLPLRWHRDCEIVPNYMPPFPRADTKPRVIVRHRNGASLRYSAGPRQGYYWDHYGDDMITVELAILALAEAPDPTGRHWPSGHGTFDPVKVQVVPDGNPPCPRCNGVNGEHALGSLCGATP